MLEDEPTTFPTSTDPGGTDAAPAARRRRAPAKKAAAPAAFEPPSLLPAAAGSAVSGLEPAVTGGSAITPRKRTAKKATASATAQEMTMPAGIVDSGADSGADNPPAKKATAKRAARGRVAAGASPEKAAAATATDPAAPAMTAAALPATPIAPVIPTVLFQAPQPEAAVHPRRDRARSEVAAAGQAPASGGPEGSATAAPTGRAASDNSDSRAASDNDGADGTEREGARRRRRGGRGRRGHAGENAHEETAGQGAAADTPAESGSDTSAEGDGAEAPRRRTRSRTPRAPGDGDAATADGAGTRAESGHRSEAGGGPDGDDHDDEGDGEGGSASSRRRRRRRRRGTGADGDEHAPDDPPNTVVRVREPREHDDRGVQGVKGSTRLEAKKQRRREGREQIRRGRRGLVITEAEFLARRESVDRVMVVRQRGERTQIGVVEDGILVEHFVSTASTNRMVGNVFLGRVQNVLPGMEAAFVDIGKGRNAVLYAGEVNFDTSGLDGQPRRIESALKPGQAVLVQVTKDPIGHKGARLTSQVSLPGRYLVYVPEGSMMGISRKLPDVERSRLKAILKKVTPEGAGVIVRTAAEGASEEELARDVARLSAQWEDIKKKSETANAPSLLYGEPDLTIRVIRDVFNEDFNSLVVQADSEWDTVEAYVGHVAPDLVSRLSHWTSEEDIFAHYRIDEQIAKALDRKVWLPSGGYLIIDRTEAMIVIDVNTGRFIGKGGNLEETVTKNNLEAAEEIVRQLRLRDIGGIIVIDFIDMVLENNRDLVLRRLVECLGRDRTKHQVAEVTSLGLVQMTRKRVGNGLLEAFSEVCETCNGRGVIVHTDLVEPRSARQSASVPPKPGPALVAKASRGGRGTRAVPAGNAPVLAAESSATIEGSASSTASAGGGTPAGDVHDNADVHDNTDGDASATGSTGSTSGGTRTRRGGRRRGGSKVAAVSPDDASSSDHVPASDPVPEPA